MKNNILDSELVCIYENKRVTNYFKEEPFNPSVGYEEYPFGINLSTKKNYVYESVRECLKLMGLDKENINSEMWNPFKDIIKPGDKVVIKPNFVIDRHYDGGDLWCVVTHPSVIRAIVDYVYIALKGEGSIVIADSPQADSDFDNFLKVSKLEAIKKFYKENADFDIEIYDLRQIRFNYNENGFLDSNSRIEQNGDPLGYAIVDLKGESEFSTLDSYDNLYGADYDRTETIVHHNKNKNEYCISKTVLSADVVVSIPKMKIHRKVGITLNLKNLVGINGNKNYLPHFQIGTPEDGGDEFPMLDKKQKAVFYTNRKLTDKLLSKPNPIKDKIYELSKRTYKILKKVLKLDIQTQNVIKAGDWYGNDTTWRMVVDLNKILIYSDKEGNMKDTPQRRFISIIDGIIGGEGEGPLVPDAKPCGIIVCGFNPYIVDAAVTKLMGIDYKKIRKFKAVEELEGLKISNINVENALIKSNNNKYINLVKSNNRFLEFKPAKGWKNKIET